MSRNSGGRPVFDAAAVLALLQNERGAEVLRKLQPEAVVNAVNAAEVLAKLVSRGMRIQEAQAAFDALHLETAPFEAELAVLSAHYVHKSVSLGDRCFLAAARLLGTGWTSDHALSAHLFNCLFTIGANNAIRRPPEVQESEGESGLPRGRILGPLYRE